MTTRMVGGKTLRRRGSRSGSNISGLKASMLSPSVRPKISWRYAPCAVLYRASIISLTPWLCHGGTTDWLCGQSDTPRSLHLGQTTVTSIRFTTDVPSLNLAFHSVADGPVDDELGLDTQSSTVPITRRSGKITLKKMSMSMKLASSAKKNCAVVPRIVSTTAGREISSLVYSTPFSSVNVTLMPVAAHAILHLRPTPRDTRLLSTVCTSPTNASAMRCPVEMTHIVIPSNDSRIMAAIWADDRVLPKRRGHWNTQIGRSRPGWIPMYSLIARPWTFQSAAKMMGARARSTLDCIITCAGVGDVSESTSIWWYSIIDRMMPAPRIVATSGVPPRPLYDTECASVRWRLVHAVCSVWSSAARLRPRLCGSSAITDWYTGRGRRAASRASRAARSIPSASYGVCGALCGAQIAPPCQPPPPHSVCAQSGARSLLIQGGTVCGAV